jgi:hypothetical protein
VIVGAGDGALVLAVGARARGDRGGAVYPVDDAARRHGAGVEAATSKPSDAYAGFSELETSTYPGGLLPD